MLEGSDTALAGEKKQVNFRLNFIFYWTGTSFVVMFVSRCYRLELPINC